jgi:hypothetical protein
MPFVVLGATLGAGAKLAFTAGTFGTDGVLWWGAGCVALWVEGVFVKGAFVVIGLAI